MPNRRTTYRYRLLGLGDRIDVFFHAFSNVYSRLRRRGEPMAELTALRQALTAFLGDERFRKFVGQGCPDGRLRYWQEQEWGRFSAAHPEFAVSLEEFKLALRIWERENPSHYSSWNEVVTDEDYISSIENLHQAREMLVDRLPNWRNELWEYKDQIRNTYWFGIMSKAVALCEIVVAGCGQYSLPHPDEKKRTMGQWINLIKQVPNRLPASAEARESFITLIGQLLIFRNDFVHRAFTVSGTQFALAFLGCCEQLVNLEVVVHIAEASSDAA